MHPPVLVLDRAPRVQWVSPTAKYLFLLPLCLTPNKWRCHQVLRGISVGIFILNFLPAGMDNVDLLHVLAFLIYKIFYTHAVTFGDFMYNDNSTGRTLGVRQIFTCTVHRRIDVVASTVFDLYLGTHSRYDQHRTVGTEIDLCRVVVQKSSTSCRGQLHPVCVPPTGSERSGRPCRAGCRGVAASSSSPSLLPHPSCQPSLATLVVELRAEAEKTAFEAAQGGRSELPILTPSLAAIEGLPSHVQEVWEEEGGR